MTTDANDLPPKLSRSSIVRVLSRYGTCAPTLPSLPPLRPLSALTTRPSADRDPLMLRASAAASPSAPVRAIRSDPARSTNSAAHLRALEFKVELEFEFEAELVELARREMCRVTRQWLRDERSFRRCDLAVRVASTVRAKRAISSAVRRGVTFSPTVANEGSNDFFCDGFITREDEGRPSRSLSVDMCVCVFSALPPVDLQIHIHACNFSQ